MAEQSVMKRKEQVKEQTFEITGMTCAACATRIEKGLNKMQGVENATVNLALEKATVKYRVDELSPSEIKEKVEGLGYGIVTEKIELDISGMTCAACATRIEKGLNKMAGVNKATVNLALENATVEYNPATVVPEELIGKVTKLGYGATKKESKQASINQKEAEFKRQKRKFIFSMILSLPLLWTMVGHFSFTSFLYVPDLLMNPWVQMALATPIQFFVGKQFYVGAYKALKNKSANMDVLVALGTSAAYFYSVYLSFETLGHSGHPAGLYFETSAILITLILLGKLFETKAKGRSSEAIKKLMGLQAKTAVVIRHGEQMEIPLEEVVAGEMLLVKPGEKIPVDGEIIEGQSAIDESMLTGRAFQLINRLGTLL